MKNINIIEINEENCQMWEDICQCGYSALEGNEEDKEAFEVSISSTELKSYMWAGNEKMVRIIEKALNDYDYEMWKAEEAREEEDNWNRWEAYTYERECYPHL